MEVYRSGQDAFLRLDPDEKLVQSLTGFAQTHQVEFATITSGVGMLNSFTMGFFCVTKNNYAVYDVAGIYDLSSISGNIALFESAPRPHVHIVANKPDFDTVSGHLIEAHTHITMEIGLRIFDKSDLKRTTQDGRPATFITRL